jgi:peptidyl-prolyl cis-trans isomerase B (cyclophilin B)
MRFAWCVALVCLLVGLLGCGGGGGGSSKKPVTDISISPADAKIDPGESISFTATLTGGTGAVDWSTTGGTIDATGRYTAPTTPGNYTVTAALRSDTTKRGSVTVQVLPPPVVQFIRTAPLVMVPRSTFSFVANTLNSVDRRVDYSAPDGGTITALGVFTAPATPGSYRIVATSIANPSLSGSFTVTVAANVRATFNIQGKGAVVLNLRPDKAPNTVANFVSLINSGYYDGIFFHRYVAGFVIQAGDPQTRTLPLTDPAIGSGGPGYTIDFEANDLLHTKYALAMARTNAGLNTAGGQFYITLDPQPSLDGSYVVFGNVASGEAIVDTLRVGDLITSATVAAE